MNCDNVILLTAFEPFGGDDVNPTEIVLERLPDVIAGFKIEKTVLPVEFLKAPEIAIRRFDELRPEAVVMMGQAGGRDAITPEKYGKNVMNGRIPDNAGFSPEKLPVTEGGAEVIDSTLPVEKIVEGVNEVGVPARLSEDAGEYVCNCLLYKMLEHIGGSVPAGFIHVPFIKEQGPPDKPFLELGDIVKGITAAIGEVAKDITGKEI